MPRKLQRRKKSKVIEVNPEDIQIIKEYPDAKCISVDCTRKAVGKSVFCKKHGGGTLIPENLMEYKKAPISLVAGSSFKPKFHPVQFIALSKQGKSTIQIAAKFGVSKGTLEKWANTFIEFNTAYEAGLTAQEAWWQTYAIKNLGDNRINTKLFTFMTGQLYGYSDKIETKNMHVHAGVLLVPGTKSQEDWEDENG